MKQEATTSKFLRNLSRGNSRENFVSAIYNIFFNGEYTSPYEFNELLGVLHQEKVAVCDECGADFNGDLLALLDHLKETGHKDSIYNRFEKYFAIEA